MLTYQPEVLQRDVIEWLKVGIPGLRTTGWKEAVKEAFLPEFTEGGQDTPEEGFSALEIALIPDAYVIDLEERELHFFEVEVSHLLKRRKLEKYAVFKTDMDYYGIAFSLFTVNKHGHVNEIDLFYHFLSATREEGQCC